MNPQTIVSYFKTKFLMAGIILALVGWFLLFVVAFGQFFESELSGLEMFLQSFEFTWSFRIGIIVAGIVLIRKREAVSRLFRKRKFRIGFWVLFLVGLLGWILGLGSLFV